MRENGFPPFVLKRPLTVVATDDALDGARLAPGFDLPPSYREFARSFGYGRLFDMMILYIPMGDYPDSLTVRSPELGGFLKKCVKDDYFEYSPDGDPALIDQLIPFGISENGHYFAWNPAEPTDPGEYVIYAIGPHTLSVTRAARDLREFLWTCTDDRVKRTLGPGYKPLAPTFEPAPKV